MISEPVYWLALPVAVAVFWGLPRSWRMPFLGLASLAFLASWDAAAAAVFLLWGLGLAGLASSRRTASTAGVVWALVLSLAICKLLPLLAGRWFGTEAASALWVPLGISYFTFRMVHFVVEAQRGRFRDLRKGDFLAYAFFFPILVAGPIERLDHWLANREETWRARLLMEGSQRILHGLVKKLVIADLFLPMLLGPYRGGTDLFFERLAVLPPYKVWGFLGVQYLFFYFDFAGYSDIAIGTSRLFGFRVQENFRWPLLARNLNDFWKRWHVSLASFCQSYIFLPVLGRTRRPVRAIVATFVGMGLWHAPTPGWLLWGLYHAAGVIVVSAFGRWRRRRGWRFLDRAPWSWIGIPLTGLAVTASFAFVVVFPRHGAWQSLRILSALFGLPLGD